MAEICLDCKHWVSREDRIDVLKRIGEPEFMDVGWGECHQDSPKSFQWLAHRWPPCHEDEWCGKYTPKV